MLKFRRHIIVYSLFDAVATCLSGPIEVNATAKTRLARPLPYGVCKGCNGSVQNGAFEHPDKTIWHVDCYDGSGGSQEVDVRIVDIAWRDRDSEVKLRR